MSYQVKELLLADGDSPFAEWFGSLEAVALWEDYKRRKASTPKGGK